MREVNLTRCSSVGMEGTPIAGREGLTDLGPSRGEVGGGGGSLKFSE